MSHNIAFQISKASFSYTGNVSDKVLYIENLQIPKGKVVFILGASGCGKSTLLEALGLMNNTLSGGELKFHGHPDGIDLGGLWNDRNGLYKVRKEYFSFIFQNTNLMESFTAYENVSLPLMIQANENQLDSYTTAEVLMRKVGLPTQSVGFDKMSFHLSGGQRQRLSFVRALNSKFEVLFCDEPTGNLDQFNAKELFEIIRSSISENQTAIIVSHDIDLALEYADIILCLSRDKNGVGILRDEHAFFPTNQSVEVVRKTILELYTSKKDIQNEAAQVPMDLADDIRNRKFESLFRRREGRSIIGKRFLNFAILCSIFAITFLAIGFSNGTRSYINDKMNNPFVQWITVQIPFGLEKEYIDSLMLEFRTGDVKKKFEIKNLSTYYVSNGIFLKPINSSENAEFRARGRTFDFENGKPDPVLQDLLTDQNLISGTSKPFESESEMGVVVTEKLLRDLGFNDPGIQFLPVEYSIPDLNSDLEKKVVVPVPIRSVVKDILGKIDIGFTNEFFFALRDNSGMFNPESYKSLYFHLRGSKEDAVIFRRKLNTYFKSHPDYSPVVKSPKIYSAGQGAGFTIKVIFKDPNFPSGFLDQTFSSLSKSDGFPQSGFSRIYDFTEAHNSNEFMTKAENISLNFSNLEKIEPFGRYLLDLKKGDKDYALEVDTSRVKEKKNFNFLSKILLAISVLLISFAAISICLFISNLLRMHLEKVRMNIGTFMAFGLAGKTVRNVYLQIIVFFIFGAMFCGYLVSICLGLGLDTIMSSMVREENITFFRLSDFWTLWILFSILFISCLTSWLTIRKILLRTPGDLIYNR